MLLIIQDPGRPEVIEVFSHSRNCWIAKMFHDSKVGGGTSGSASLPCTFRLYSVLNSLALCVLASYHRQGKQFCCWSSIQVSSLAAGILPSVLSHSHRLPPLWVIERSTGNSSLSLWTESRGPLRTSYGASSRTRKASQTGEKTPIGCFGGGGGRGLEAQSLAASAW